MMYQIHQALRLVLHVLASSVLFVNPCIDGLYLTLAPTEDWGCIECRDFGKTLLLQLLLAV